MRPGDLVPGNCYFTFAYFDTEMLFPMVQTLRYLRCEDLGSEGRRWLFEEPGSSGPADSRSLWSFPEAQLHDIIELPQLMQALAEVAPDHPIKPAPGEHSAPANMDDLSAQLDRLFDAQGESVTITIRFTDDGVGLTRRPDGSFRFLLFPSTRRNPDMEPRIRQLFTGVGLVPDEDYLSNMGRVRVLAYPVPGDRAAVASLCRRIFQEVYGIRPGDTLRYQWSANHAGGRTTGCS